jgi:hypothetical protein
MTHRQARKWRPAMPGRITSDQQLIFPARFPAHPVLPGVGLDDDPTAVPINLQPERLPI